MQHARKLLLLVQRLELADHLDQPRRTSGVVAAGLADAAQAVAQRVLVDVRARSSARVADRRARAEGWIETLLVEVPGVGGQGLGI
jgi:hypothetical protein